MDKRFGAVSPWALSLVRQLAAQHATVLVEKQLQSRLVQLVLVNDSLVLTVSRPGGAKLLLRVAFTPVADFTVDGDPEGSGLHYTLQSATGRYQAAISLNEDGELPLIHYETRFTPTDNMLAPFWPKDMLLLNPEGSLGGIELHPYIEQLGPRSGMVYFSTSIPETGAVLYFQNLTALNTYCADTTTSVADTVDGGGPEFGFALPAPTDKPLQGGKEYVFSDAYIAFADNVPTDQFDQAKQFIDLLAGVYVRLPKPPTQYHDYHGVAKSALRALAEHKGCWSYHGGHGYLNAYVSDYQTPPEIMVQLAVLLPLKEYEVWMGEKLPLTTDLEAGLNQFYNADIGTVQRWLPAAQNQLDGSEEHKKPLVMDSWYLHHPLLNLSRMALHGDEVGKDLFLKSLDYAIKVAHHFDYNWPIFYKMDTLEVIKAEAKPGAGGEKDVAGIYAHVMLQAWDLTGEDSYLGEAKRAAKSLLPHGFDVFYQANNTVFAAGAMLRLWNATKDEMYLNLGYLFLANIFKNVALWESDHGYGKNYPLFFAVFPLDEAPYSAVYEEIEVMAGIQSYLQQADEAPLPRSYALLLAEFIRYALNRMLFYYPTVLPREMLADEVTTGEVDSDLWVPLEDIYPEWEKSGTVGQEVYGAGFPFVIVARQYMKIAEGRCLLFIDYPTSERLEGSRQASFKVLGDKRLFCKLYLIQLEEGQPVEVAVMTFLHGRATPKTDDGAMACYEVQGEQRVTVKW